MKKIIWIAAVFFLLASCKKEKVYVYGVDDVDVTQPGANKPNLKSDLEFVSIAYTDLFGNTIPTSMLDELVKCYVSFGDKRLMIDMIILNWLNEPGVQIPTESEMRADPAGFTDKTYLKFFLREPGQFERWNLVDKIQKDTALTPELVFYSFMTSNEYRYY